VGGRWAKIKIREKIAYFLGIITEIPPCECEKVYFSVFFSIRTFGHGGERDGEAGGDFFSFFLFFFSF
jgi:hypothetical protein